MTKFFTHYWKDFDLQESVTTDHTAGNEFRRKGVRPGDYIYVVGTLSGTMYLVGRMKVAEIANQKRARQMLPYEPWKADEHCIAEPGTATSMAAIKVPIAAVRALRCVSPTNGPVALKFRTGDRSRLDPQTLRQVRELTPESARSLDALLSTDGISEPAHDDSIADSPNVPQGGAGFGSAEADRMAEEKAIELVTSFLTSEGWIVRSVESQGCGYDLMCSRDQDVKHVEVKGVSGTEPSFPITHGEVRRAQSDPAFEIHVVTNVLSSRPIHERWSGHEFSMRFELRPIQYLASLRRPAS